MLSGRLRECLAKWSQVRGKYTQETRNIRGVIRTPSLNIIQSDVARPARLPRNMISWRSASHYLWFWDRYKKTPQQWAQRSIYLWGESKDQWDIDKTWVHVSFDSDHIRRLLDIGNTERNSYTATIGLHWLGWISDFVSNKSLQQLADQAPLLCSSNIYAQTFA